MYAHGCSGFHGAGSTKTRRTDALLSQDLPVPSWTSSPDTWTSSERWWCLLTHTHTHTRLSLIPSSWALLRRSCLRLHFLWVSWSCRLSMDLSFSTYLDHCKHFLFTFWPSIPTLSLKTPLRCVAKLPQIPLCPYSVVQTNISWVKASTLNSSHYLSHRCLKSTRGKNSEIIQ